MRNRSFFILVSLCLVTILMVGCTEQNKTNKDTKHEIIISAASSLTNALVEIQKEFELLYPQYKLSFNFGSSGKLAQQIEQGAPADLFLSADLKWMTYLLEKGYIEQDSMIHFARNTLVVVGQARTDLSITTLEEITPDLISLIAIGDPKSVPAGSYAKEALEYNQIWERVASKLIIAKDVRQVMTYVETGNTDLGFVYASDALTSDQVKVLFQIDPSWHSPIIYPAGMVKESKDKEAANLFLQFLSSTHAKQIFVKNGFHN